MQAYDVISFDDPPRLVSRPRPVPGRGQALIKVAACGLNFADLLMAKGRYQDTPTPPFTLGLEVSGFIEALGPDTSGPSLGTRVAAYVGSGGLAEYCVAPVDRCLPLHDSLSDSVAAGFQIAYGTSHLALVRRARLRPGETLCVLGAAGGVGLTAVEIGKALGARVIAVVRGEDKRAVVEKAGADHVLDADTDLKQALRDLGRVDVVYDPVGGDAFAATLGAIKPEGKILVIGFASGDVPPIPANHLLVKNVDVIGFYWGGYLRFNPGALTDSMDQLIQWHAAGRLAPVVSHVLPLDRVEEGLALLSERRAQGKVVITP